MKTVPRDYQLEAIEFAKDREYFANLLPMGLGKTLVELFRILHLRNEHYLTGVLYICPKSIYSSIQDQFDTHWDKEKHPIDIAFWTGSTSKVYQAELKKLLNPYDSLKVLVVNVEAFSHERILKLVKAFANAHCNPFDKSRATNMCIVDESSRIKFNKAKRTKTILQVAKLFKYRDIMTGTPVLNKPTDLWTQAQFLHPLALDETSFVVFRQKYCQLELCHIPDYRNGTVLRNSSGAIQTRAFYKITGSKNVEVLREKLYKFAFRKEKHEVLNLPPKIYSQRYVEMTPEQKKLYIQLKRETTVKLERGKINAQNAVVTLTRIQQLLCGYLPDTEGNHIPVPSNRVNELLSVLEESEGKILIWAHYKKPIEEIIAAITKEYGNKSVVRYDGAVSDADRKEAIERLNNDPETRFFVSNPTVGGVGLTLNAASTAIYYMNSANLEHRLQSEDRNHRIGTTGTVNVIDLVTKGTIDEKMMKLLKMKSDFATEVLGDSRKLLDFFNQDEE